MDPPTTNPNLSVRLFLDHQMNPHDSTFHDPKTPAQQEHSFQPELADWMLTLGHRPGESLFLALKRCIEMTGTCPVAFVKGKAVELLDEPLDWKSCCHCWRTSERQKEKDCAGDARKPIGEGVGAMTSLDLCFSRLCKTCSLMVQDQKTPVLTSVSFWSKSTKKVYLGHVPAALEVGDVKLLVGKLIDRQAGDLSLFYDDENLKDLCLLSDLTDGHSLLLRLWEENKQTKAVSNLKVQWESLVTQQTDLEKEQTQAVQSMKEEKEKMAKSVKVSLQKLEEERDKEMERIKLRYNGLISELQEEEKMMEVMLDNDIAELQRQTEKVKALSDNSLKREKALLSTSSKLSASSLYAYLSITADDMIVVELRNDVVPKTVRNFLSLCTGEKGYDYKGVTMAKGLHQAYEVVGGVPKEDWVDPENFHLKHTRPGTLSMMGSESEDGEKCVSTACFTISMRKATKFDELDVVFGQVVSGFDVFRKVQDDVIVIADCGQFLKK